MNDLDDELTRGDALQDFLADRTLLHVLDELLDDLVIDVGVEEHAADLAKGLGNVLFGDLTLAAKPFKDEVELLT